ncbi:MAG: threonine/serine exporter family protein [Candidatus Cloacimonadaceae bacterium]|nr:threonine/serine exporter family protein [Candidatus Cloacimonadota bacterium]MDD4034839.1 threonine/serine exporter family protein [Candidatus Cloacimonadota bacterium]HPF08119.1 threonine/serine exporter family protein [Candidatus Cloacimonadota bacterium]
MNKISLQECSKLALETGRIILQSGGTTNRVELMMHKVCQGFGFEDSESFVTPTGIFLSLGDGDEQISTRIKRIEQRRIDLGKITQVSKLVNALQADIHNSRPLGETRSRDFYQELVRIDRENPYPTWVINLSGGATSGFFCLLFGGSWIEFAIAFLIGCLISLSLKYISKLPVNNFLLNALASALIVLLAKTIDTWIPNIRLDNIIIGGIMILVPGLALTNAIRDTMSGDLVSGTARGVEALIITIGIVAGSGAMLKVWDLLGY